jgi:hypothetical protein
MNLIKISVLVLCVIGCLSAHECTPLAVQSNVDSLVTKLNMKVPVSQNDLTVMLQTCEIAPEQKTTTLTYKDVLENLQTPAPLREFALVCQSINPISDSARTTLLYLFNRVYQQFLEENQYLDSIKKAEEKDINSGGLGAIDYVLSNLKQITQERNH